ncbi:MAG: ethanolamine utilization protein EutM [Clostridia bacterium]|nr:ethanolamine utilization protein EutM [Clostridia bacterium]
MSNALGLIEAVGLPVAIEAADTAIKSADVKLIGIELTNGGGLVVVKLLGDVGAIKAAVSSGAKAAEKVGKIWATHVIPRPNPNINSNFYPNLGNREEQNAEKQDENKRLEQNEEKDKKTETRSKPDTEENFIDTPEEQKDITEGEVTCNLCNDPLCPRKKGEPRINCINYARN